MTPTTTRAELELAIQRALMDDDSYGVGCDDQDALEAAASFSATFIANAIASGQPATPTGGVMEATAAQHVGRPKGEPAQFVRNGKLETCQCLDCRDLARSSAATATPMAWLVEHRHKRDGNWSAGGGSSIFYGDHLNDYAKHVAKLRGLDFVETVEVTPLYRDAAQPSRRIPPPNEIRKLIDDFIAPDLDTEKAFASHRRDWIVQCLQAALTLSSTEGK